MKCDAERQNAQPQRVMLTTKLNGPTLAPSQFPAPPRNAPRTLTLRLFWMLRSRAFGREHQRINDGRRFLGRREDELGEPRPHAGRYLAIGELTVDDLRARHAAIRIDDHLHHDATFELSILR